MTKPWIAAPTFPGFEQANGGRVWPEPDWELSPYTGLTRAHWEYVADGLLYSVRQYASEDHATISLPGKTGGYGARVDALEGFTRSFMLAAFRIAGDPENTTELAQWYAQGIAAGVDPTNPGRWLRPDEVDQAKVEAAAIVLGLHLIRAQIWEGLSETTKQQVIDYLATFIHGSRPLNNWVWFRIITEQFLASVGGPYSEADMQEDLELHESYIRSGGWLTDGPGRNFDHYVGWALHLYPPLWADMVQDPTPEQQELFTRYSQNLNEFLPDYAHLVDAHGGPLFQGRSLIYRFAAAAPLWVGAWDNSPALSMGTIRRGASGILQYFLNAGVPNADGLLDIGWGHAWQQMAQNYSGTGSPYWAAKGMLGLALPASHPVWQTTEEPLPVDEGSFHRVMPVPGWVASGTASDGVVRVYNHGTDHTHHGERQFDPPLYARFGYSTVTAPILTPEAERDPMDQAVGLIKDGRVSHRSGFTPGPITQLENGVIAARSHVAAYWLEGEPLGPDHGDGRPATGFTPGPWINVVSVINGAWEVRIASAHSHPDQEVDADLRWHISGWNICGDQVKTAVLAEHNRIEISLASGLTSVLVTDGTGQLEYQELQDASPLGARSAFPQWRTSMQLKQPQIVAIGLGHDLGAAPQWKITNGEVHITWPDGAESHVVLQEVA